MDKDGWVDFVAVRAVYVPNETNNGVELMYFRNLGNSSGFAEPISIGGVFHDSVYYYGYPSRAPFAIADFDGDGFYDVVVRAHSFPSAHSSRLSLTSMIFSYW
jgi:hypothetical protein